MCFSWAARFASRGHPSLFLMGLVKASVLGADLGKGPGGRLRTRGDNTRARQSQTLLYFLSQRSRPFLTPAALPARRGAWCCRSPSFWRTCSASGPAPSWLPSSPAALAALRISHCSSVLLLSSRMLFPSFTCCCLLSSCCLCSFPSFHLFFFVIPLLSSCLALGEKQQ